MAEHNRFGIEAERRAALFLEDKNYTILKKNWRYLKAEIDIIAQDPDSQEIVIVEVKARNNPMMDPELAVNKKKKRLLIFAANEYLISNNIDFETRFDIISVEVKDSEWIFEHIENAFLSFE